MRQISRRCFCNATCLTLLAITVGVVVGGCGPGTGQLEGEVFVVTEGRESIRLALVEVRLYDADSLAKHLNNKIDEGEEAAEDYEKVVQSTVESVEKAKEAYFILKRESDALFEAYMNEPFARSRERESLWRKYKEASEKRDIAEIVVRLTREESSFFKGKQEHWKSRTFLFEDLPTALATVKTDADGKFSLELEKAKQYALTAMSTRLVGGDQREEYFWVDWPLLKRDEERRFLSNDNLLPEFPSREDLIPLALRHTNTEASEIPKPRAPSSD